MPNAQAPSCCAVGGDERDGLRWGVGWRQAGSEEEGKEVRETFGYHQLCLYQSLRGTGTSLPGGGIRSSRQTQLGSLGGASLSSVAKMPLPS